MSLNQFFNRSAYRGYACGQDVSTFNVGEAACRERLLDSGSIFCECFLKQLAMTIQVGLHEFGYDITEDCQRVFIRSGVCAPEPLPYFVELVCGGWITFET